MIARALKRALTNPVNVFHELVGRQQLTLKN
jgi:hypothetical protein